MIAKKLVLPDYLYWLKVAKMWNVQVTHICNFFGRIVTWTVDLLAADAGSRLWESFPETSASWQWTWVRRHPRLCQTWSDVPLSDMVRCFTEQHKPERRVWPACGFKHNWSQIVSLSCLCTLLGIGGVRIVEKCQTTKCWMTKCQMTKCQMTKCQMTKCQMTKCQMTKCQMTKCQMTKCQITKCQMTKCQMTKQMTKCRI
jgi:hypothetical protein